MNLFIFRTDLWEIADAVKAETMAKRLRIMTNFIFFLFFITRNDLLTLNQGWAFGPGRPELDRASSIFGLRDRARSHRDDRDRAERHRARFFGSARY